MDFTAAGNEIADVEEYDLAHGKRGVEGKNLRPGDKLKVVPEKRENLMYLRALTHTRKKPVPFDKEVPVDDFLFRVATLKPLEADIFMRLAVTRDHKTNICLLAPFPKSKKSMLYAALRGLKEKDIVRRVKKGEYQVNPWGIIPPPGYRIRARALWDELG